LGCVYASKHVTDAATRSDLDWRDALEVRMGVPRLVGWCVGGNGFGRGVDEATGVGDGGRGDAVDASRSMTWSVVLVRRMGQVDGVWICMSENGLGARCCGLGKYLGARCCTVGVGFRSVVAILLRLASARFGNSTFLAASHAHGVEAAPPEQGDSP